MNVTVAQDAGSDLLIRHPQDLGGRLHFMGVLSDEEFMSAMAVCDAVVLPYMEVGQSGSGPISMAMDMGCRIVASRTKTFLSYSKYFPGRIEIFDIGNHLELAAHIGSKAPPTSGLPPAEYGVESNVAIYRAANGPARK